MVKQAPPTGNKTYILTLKDRATIRKVTVPASWKMTFGATAPYSGKGSDYNTALALRFYEGSEKNKNLRAVFTDVCAVRDADIVIAERRTETQRKVVQKHTDKGAKDVVVEARVTEWVNPDDDDEASNPFADQLAPSMKQLMGSDDGLDF